MLIASLALPISVMAKGVSTTAQLTYSLQIFSVNYSENSATIKGKAGVANIIGKENEYFLKTNWGDGQVDITPLISLSSYYKSSKTLNIPDLQLSHNYQYQQNYGVNIKIYRGTLNGEELNYGNANVSFSYENTQASCSDLRDNDIDQQTDLNDSDCLQYLVSENTQAFCSDGIVNDLNTKIDLADINSASYLPREDQLVACSDGIDNDRDGTVDLMDNDCASFRPGENTLDFCQDSKDNDFDKLVDGQDSDCKTVLPLENTVELCRDSLDNDMDSKYDWDDSDCVSFISPDAVCPTGYLIFFFPGGQFICAAHAGY